MASREQESFQVLIDVENDRKAECANKFAYHRVLGR